MQLLAGTIFLGKYIYDTSVTVKNVVHLDCEAGSIAEAPILFFGKTKNLLCYSIHGYFYDNQSVGIVSPCHSFLGFNTGNEPNNWNWGFCPPYLLTYRYLPYWNFSIPGWTNQCNFQSFLLTILSFKDTSESSSYLCRSTALITGELLLLKYIIGQFEKDLACRLEVFNSEGAQKQKDRRIALLQNSQLWRTFSVSLLART